MRTYNSTRIACYAAYVVQSIVNNLSPLFFVIYQKNYNISYSMISFLLLINFVTQLVVDISSTLFIGRLGYRKSICLANLVSAAGLMFLPTLPVVLPPMAGLTIATMVMAAGSGLIEVLASPLMENLPTKQGGANEFTALLFLLGAGSGGNFLHLVLAFFQPLAIFAVYLGNGAPGKLYKFFNRTHC